MGAFPPVPHSGSSLPFAPVLGPVPYCSFDFLMKYSRGYNPGLVHKVYSDTITTEPVTSKKERVIYCEPGFLILVPCTIPDSLHSCATFHPRPPHRFRSSGRGSVPPGDNHLTRTPVLVRRGGKNPPASPSGCPPLERIGESDDPVRLLVSPARLRAGSSRRTPDPPDGEGSGATGRLEESGFRRVPRCTT